MLRITAVIGAAGAPGKFSFELSSVSSLKVKSIFVTLRLAIVYITFQALWQFFQEIWCSYGIPVPLMLCTLRLNDYLRCRCNELDIVFRTASTANVQLA